MAPKGGEIMDFKIKVKCEDCRCTFELRPVDFKKRDRLECPNCGLQFPDDIFQSLKTGIEALGDVPERATLGPDSSPIGEKPHCFLLSVESYSEINDILSVD